MASLMAFQIQLPMALKPSNLGADGVLDLVPDPPSQASLEHDPMRLRTLDDPIHDGLPNSASAR
jgi:hypothetical protein